MSLEEQGRTAWKAMMMYFRIGDPQRAMKMNKLWLDINSQIRDKTE